MLVAREDLITQEDRALILGTANGLPPLSKFIGATPDQVARLQLVVEHFQDLKQALSAYFAGEANPVGQGDPKRKRLIEHEASYYLDAYNLFWFGWSEITAEVAKQPDPSFQIFPKSPGAAIAMLLELDCDQMIDVCLFEGKTNIRESISILKGLPNLNSGTGLSKKREQRTQQYTDDLTERSVVGSGHFLRFCEHAVKKRLRGKFTLNEKLKRFKNTRNSRLSELRKRLKADGIRGEKWIEGKVFSN